MPLREDLGAVSNRIERKVIDRLDERDGLDDSRAERRSRRFGLVTVSRMMIGAAEAGAVIAVAAEMASSAAVAVSTSASFFMSLPCSVIACRSERASRYGRSSSFTRR